MKSSERIPERLCLAGAGLALACGGLWWWLNRPAGSPALTGLVALAGLAGAVALLSFLHAKLQRLAAAERAAQGEGTADDTALFADRAAALVRGRNLRQFERFVVPAATLILALAEAGMGAQLLRQLGRPPTLPAADTSKLLAAVLAGGGVLCYLLGSYLGGLAFSGRLGVLRALAGELIGLAWLSGAGLAVALLSLTELPNGQGVLAGAVAVLLLWRALEKLLGAIMELYRPRRPGGEDRPLYASRVNDLVAQPQSLFASLADTLNYQFGIALSPAALHRAGRALGLLLLAHVGVLLAFSAVVVVRTGEQVRLERLGRPAADGGELGPGLHLKLPWPLAQVYREPVAAVRQLTLVAARPAATPVPADTAATRLWQDDTAAAAELYVTASRPADAAPGATAAPTGAVNLVALEVVIQYRVADLNAYLYTSSEPVRLLEALARRELSETLAGLDFLALLDARQDALNAALRERLQAACTARQLGLEIVLVAGRRRQPPAGEVADAFALADASGETRQKLILEAERAGRQQLTRETLAATELRRQTDEYAYRHTRLAAAEVASNQRLRELYRQHRELYRARAFLDRLERLRDVRKVVIATDVPDQVIQFDLKKSQTELFDLTKEPEQ